MTDDTIFANALEQADPAARAAYLAEACAGDPERRRRVEGLLGAHEKARDFLEKPLVAVADLGLMPTRNLQGGETDPGESEDALTFLAPATRPDALGRLGGYEVLQVLGQGGSGIVLRVFDDVLQRVVAVKVLAPRLALTSPARKRFLREARASASVRHENVVQVHAIGEQPLPYLVMEYIPGETLQQRLDRTGPLDTAEVVTIGRQIAEGLAAAHAQGLIHRDIKPGNILIEAGPSERVKITDFGLARAADDASLTQSGVVAGTPLFMAPEQARGDALDHRADLFSLGSVLYTMCSGRPPFRANNTLAVLKRVAEDTPRPIPEIIPEVPRWLCDLISKLHAKKPDDRFASAREVADLLARHLVQSFWPVTTEVPPAAPPAVEERPPTEPPRPATRPRRRVALWAAAALLVVLGGLGLGEATGVSDVRGTVIRLFSPEGTLVVEVDDPAVSVRIEGPELVITGAGVREIRLKPGRYVVEARKGGKLLSRELVAVTRHGRPVVRVSQEAAPPDATAWERTVAALSADKQVEAVAARLKDLNPDFDGAVESTIEGNVVTGLAFKTDRVGDISPLRALPQLTTLKCPAVTDYKGRLVDLSPLRGLPLTSLECMNNRVSDLEPLRGMKLRSLSCDSTQVTDLSPLRGMPLERFTCSYSKLADLSPLAGMSLTVAHFEFTEVADLAPLRGMPLTDLVCSNTKVTDLVPLRGMPLRILYCNGTRVSDLSPLKGMSLEGLYCVDTDVTDLSLVKGMPLRDLFLGPRITDLSPIKGMALLRLHFPAFKAERDAKLLRVITTLHSINGKPPDQFWMDVDLKGKTP